MPALQQHGVGAQLQQRSGRMVGGIGGVDTAAGEQFGLGRIGRDQTGQRQQASAQCVQCGVFEQTRTAGGHHHRVEHHEWRAVLFEQVGHAVDDLGVGQHAELDRLDLEIGKAGIDLGAQECQRRHMHGGDTTGVLRGQCGNGGQAVHAMRGEGLQVGLDAGTTAGIRTGDGQCGQRAGRGHVAILHCRGAAVQTPFNALGRGRSGAAVDGDFRERASLRVVQRAPEGSAAITGTHCGRGRFQ